MDEVELYKEMYYHELDVKEKINSRFVNPFSVYVVLIGGMGYLVSKIEEFPDKTRTGVLIMLLIIYGLSLGATGFFLYKAYYNHTYEYIENGVLLRKYKVELEKYYSDNYEKYFQIYDKSEQELVLNDFNDNLINKFIKTATHNRSINHYKYKMFLRAGQSLVVNSIIWLVIFIITMIL